MRRILVILAAAVGLTAVGCGSDGQAVSPTAPEFKQPPVRPADNAAKMQ